VLAGVFLCLLALFLVGLTAKERDDRFCIACHLHEEKFDRFVAPVSFDLAGAHHAKKGVLCIECHGGADVGMRLKVWALAAYDTGKFLVGRYGEPDHMKLQLRDKECIQCHTPILKSAAPTLSPEQEETAEGRTGDSYHAIRDHDTVQIACVRCHTSHTTDGEARFQFLARPRLLPLCRDCHPDLGEEFGAAVR